MTEQQTSTHRRLRVGAVSYLNTKPLVYRLAETEPDVDLTFDLPSRLADDLAAGRLDVALVPSIEWLREPSRVLVSDACIGCQGPVLSVKLLGRKKFAAVRTLALDEGSRTSAILARILLSERFGIAPQLTSMPIDQPVERCAADAVLLIGDRAIHPPQGGFPEVWDLGEEWCRWSGLPFVFALWVACPGADRGRLGAALSRARDAGVANLEAIARDAAAGAGLTFSQTLHYLRDNLHFFLGPRERSGLRLFFQEAAKLGAVPPDAEKVLDD